MAKYKFKVGDKVRVISNDQQPQFTGQTGVIKKVYRAFSDSASHPDGLFVYRVEVGSETLRGVAFESDFIKI